MKTPVIAVVGATGAVGEEILLCLDQLKVPHQEIKLLASARSAGKTLPFQGKDLVIQELTEDAFASVDIALFSVGSDIVKTFAPLAAETGAIVIDNSSAYRMDDDVPLVIPEINGEDAKNVPRNIIANPNCTTIVTLMALNPMHQAFGGCETLIASSYQAVSGSGAQGIAELEDQVKAYAEDQPIEVNLYPRQIAFNVIPQVEPITENGYTKEEMKMQNETRKILHAPNIRASATCVRVPVMHDTEVVLRVGESLLSSLFVQKSCFLLGHGESAIPKVVQATEVVLRIGVLLLSRLFVPKSRFLLGHGESALTMVVHETEVVLRVGVLLLSRLFVPKSRHLL